MFYYYRYNNIFVLIFSGLGDVAELSLRRKGRGLNSLVLINMGCNMFYTNEPINILE